MLSGVDVSGYQGNIDWPTLKNNVNFVVCKAAEGIGLIDNWYGNNRQQARNLNLLRGWYFFAHPELNSAVDEANYFLSICYDVQPGEILFLDYEPVGWKGDHVTWVKTFLDTIASKLNGYKAVLYTYQSMLTSNDFTPVSNEGYGLWIATASNDPTNTNFQTGSFPFAMMNQWGNQNVPGISGVVDSDVFFGIPSTWQAYGYQLPTPPAPSPVAPVEPPPSNPLPDPAPKPIPVPNPPVIPTPPATTTTTCDIKLSAIHDITYSKWSILNWVTRLHQIKFIFEKE